MFTDRGDLNGGNAWDHREEGAFTKKRGNGCAAEAAAATTAATAATAAATTGGARFRRLFHSTLVSFI